MTKYRLNKVRGAVISRAKERLGPLSSNVIHTRVCQTSFKLQLCTLLYSFFIVLVVISMTLCKVCNDCMKPWMGGINIPFSVYWYVYTYLT